MSSPSPAYKGDDTPTPRQRHQPVADIPSSQNDHEEDPVMLNPDDWPDLSMPCAHTKCRDLRLLAWRLRADQLTEMDRLVAAAALLDSIDTRHMANVEGD